ncbi:MAG: DNA-binding transcriptional LysR family regulator [Halioglobus sp.]|jgi:DNA-binding transcriptional LysR family regulator
MLYIYFTDLGGTLRYSLRQLEVFLATARYENVTRAAQALAMSQSAASGALKELEGQFDVQLFDRVGKRLQLSELGHQLRAEAEGLIDRARAFEASLAGQDVAGTIAVGATLTIGNYLTLSMIADFRQRHPETDVTLQIANTETIAAQVTGFELDVGLIEGEYHHADLETQHWRKDELVAFAAPDHPLANKTAVRDEDLLGLPWIVREPGSGTRQTFDRAMHGILTDLNIAMELQQPKAIKRAVEVGLGVGCLSRISLEESFERGTLVPLNIMERDFHREWFIITHRQKYHSAALKKWLARCTERWSN